VPGPTRWLARRVPLRRPELAGQFPRRLVLPAADGSALELGELGVPGDRRSPDRPGVTMGRGSAANWEASWRRRLGTAARRDHRLRQEPLHRRPGRSQASAGAPRRIGARRTAVTSVMTLPGSCGGDMSSPQKAHLPGTIRQPLQITALIARLRHLWRLSCEARISG